MKKRFFIPQRPLNVEVGDNRDIKKPYYITPGPLNIEVEEGKRKETERALNIKIEE